METRVNRPQGDTDCLSNFCAINLFDFEHGKDRALLRAQTRQSSLYPFAGSQLIKIPFGGARVHHFHYLFTQEIAKEGETPLFFGHTQANTKQPSRQLAVALEGVEFGLHHDEYFLKCVLQVARRQTAPL
jgi:hypothetical protein